uniref:Uncharacterized protein n=1 Tax=Glossina pallidipes TaxID=7398 RepID=A0A1A9Z3Q3_GLOPL
MERNNDCCDQEKEEEEEEEEEASILIHKSGLTSNEKFSQVSCCCRIFFENRLKLFVIFSEGSLSKGQQTTIMNELMCAMMSKAFN